ncbi:hypothetical protein PV396_42765 [Streptomyces sp. ME02-8801-2C]|nr:hypothetical protein [Streptomyces sp. ME02-8801-2C]MDX3458581.1 hypothetical protein [Streptomyces sp. ME02-8801-2C]
MRRRTREHGHRLVKLFVERAVSGTVASEERPELATGPPSNTARTRA